MNAVKPGAVRMRHGKWRIYTHLKGYRPQWMPLTVDFVCGRIRSFMGLASEPLQESRLYGWIDMLKDEAKRKDVLRQMKYVAGKKPETKLQKAVSEWAQWLNWLTMVKFAAPEKESV